jgi:serine/threonine-protein kinase RsbW
MSSEGTFRSRRDGAHRFPGERNGGSDVHMSLPAALVEDMRLAVTEACANVVRHAYHPGETGPIDITIRPERGRVELVIADRGRGLAPSPDASGPGLGLPLIAALADSVQITHGAGHGSRVSMSFHAETA